MRRRYWVLAVVLFLVLACRGGGSDTDTNDCDYYVDSAAGSDANTGGESDPFQTITFALSRAASGDEVCVAAGRYSAPEETFPLTVPMGVTLRARSGGAKPVVNGGGDLDGVNIAILAAQNSTIRGFSVTVPLSADVSVVHVGILSSEGSPGIKENTITGIGFGHDGGAGIATFGTASPLIMNNTIVLNHDGITTFGTSSPVIRGNILSDNENHGVYADQSSNPNLGTTGDPGGNTLLNNGSRGLGNFTDSTIINAAGNTWEITCSTSDGHYASTLILTTGEDCPGDTSNYYIKYEGAGIQF